MLKKIFCLNSEHPLFWSRQEINEKNSFILKSPRKFFHFFYLLRKEWNSGKKNQLRFFLCVWTFWIRKIHFLTTNFFFVRETEKKVKGNSDKRLIFFFFFSFFGEKWLIRIELSFKKCAINLLRLEMLTYLRGRMYYSEVLKYGSLTASRSSLISKTMFHVLSTWRNISFNFEKFENLLRKIKDK